MAGNVPNRDIVLFVLGELGARTVKIDTETLAIECFRRYPSRFRLVKFPEYPDVEAVRRPLDDLKEPEQGTRVVGNKEEGWLLTPSGLKWYEENKKRIATIIEDQHPLERRLPGGGNISRDKISRAVATRLMQSKAYKKWRSREGISIYEFFDAMKVDQYMEESRYQRVLDNTLKAVKGNEELTDFVEYLHSTYGKRYRTYFLDELAKEAES
jgi:hypothetical protein